jgi:alpha-N-arabinofuranosidase
MKRNSAILTLALLGCPSVTAQQAQPNIPDPLVVTVDTQQTSDAVSKYVFGRFIEHIGTLIYRSVWAELLDDRKFYFPIRKHLARKAGIHCASSYASGVQWVRKTLL